MEKLNPPSIAISSYIVVSNDSTSKKIKINKRTNLNEFYSEILDKFPELDDMKLFYFEGYLKEKFLITNEEEYVIANKKGIEYFYICGNNSNDIIDFLKYYSVIVFSPVKSLNNTFQINDRKKMQMQKLESINETIEETDETEDNYSNDKNINLINNNNLFNQSNNFNNSMNMNFNMNMNNNFMNNNYINNNYNNYFQPNSFNNNMNNFNYFGNNNQFNNFSINYNFMNNNNNFNNNNNQFFQNNQNFNYNNNNMNGYMNNFP